MALLLALLAQVDPELPAYKPEAAVEGKLTAVGSDAMWNLLTLWAEDFKKAHPAAEIESFGKGDSAIPPLVSGLAQIGLMTRAWKATEVEVFQAKYGHPPTEFKVAWDALAVFVHKDNPIRSLTLERVDAIFSKSGRRNGKPAATWGDLGLTGDWAAKPIAIHGRNSASGTYGFFKERALLNGDFKDEVKEQPGSASVVQGVLDDPAAVGYAGIGYAASGVRAVPIEGIEATEANARSETYPLARALRIYVNRDPTKPLALPVREFLRLVLSREGQLAVVKDGYFPVTAAQAVEERKKLD